MDLREDLRPLPLKKLPKVPLLDWRIATAVLSLAGPSLVTSLVSEKAGIAVLISIITASIIENGIAQKKISKEQCEYDPDSKRQIEGMVKELCQKYDIDPPKRIYTNRRDMVAQVRSNNLSIGQEIDELLKEGQSKEVKTVIAHELGGHVRHKDGSIVSLEWAARYANYAIGTVFFHLAVLPIFQGKAFGSKDFAITLSSLGLIALQGKIDRQIEARANRVAVQMTGYGKEMAEFLYPIELREAHERRKQKPVPLLKRCANKMNRTILKAFFACHPDFESQYKACLRHEEDLKQNMRLRL